VSSSAHSWGSRPQAVPAPVTVTIDCACCKDGKFVGQPGAPGAPGAPGIPGAIGNMHRYEVLWYTACMS